MTLLLTLILHLPLILMYHRVDPEVPAGAIGRTLTISPTQLSDELDFLSQRHLRAVSVDDYIKASREHRSTGDMVILTFDDGYADQYTQAFPILEQHRARATFFITTGNVGTRNHLTWAQIREMARNGMSIGGHNVKHIDLTSLTAAQQRYQIEGCLSAMRDRAGVSVDTYAYPSGTFNRTTESILASEPIVFAFTTDPSHRLGLEPRFEISRLRVKNVTTMAAFQSFFTISK